MVTGHVFIAMSLDGFVAREDSRLDWLMKQDTAGESHGYEEFVASMNGIVMGRGSFETVLGFESWPYSLPVVVLSRSLGPGDIPEALRGRVRVSGLEPSALMAELKSEGWSRVYVDGGQVVHSFLRAGLIEDLVITTVPILIGSGRRLFGPLDRDIDLTVSSQKSFPSGLTQACYTVRRAEREAT